MNQITRDYLSEIRRDHELLKELDHMDREKSIIEAFCDGLYRKLIAEIFVFFKNGKTTMRGLILNPIQL